MENRIKEVFFPNSLEIGYLLTESGKEVISNISKINEALEYSYSISLNYELLGKALGKRHNTDNREPNHILLLLHPLINRVDEIIEAHVIKDALRDDIEAGDINILIEEGFLKVDTTDSLFKFLYEEFGNYNQISPLTNSKSVRVNQAVLMYEFMNKYSNDNHFRENLMDCYNESSMESVDHLDIESVFDMLTEYQSKVDELGL